AHQVDQRAGHRLARIGGIVSDGHVTDVVVAGETALNVRQRHEDRIVVVAAAAHRPARGEHAYNLARNVVQPHVLADRTLAGDEYLLAHGRADDADVGARLLLALAEAASFVDFDAPRIEELVVHAFDLGPPVLPVVDR